MLRICPICNCSERRHLFSQRFSEIEGITFLKEYEVVQCERCGFLFADQVPNQTQFDEYYAHSSKYEGNYSGHLPSESLLRQFSASLRFLESTLDGCGLHFKTLHVVDIGCATGNFLRFMKEQGYTHLTGVDPSAACVEVLKVNGIQARQASLFQLDFEEHYDVVMLLSVLEHIRDLPRAVEAVRSLLAPNGVFFLEVPDAAHFYLEDGLAYQQFSSEHINYFTLESLRSLLASYGFDLLGHRVYQDLNTGCNTGLEAVFQLRVRTPPRVPISFDETAQESMRQYLSQCAACENRLNQALQPLVDSQEPIFVWGCGTHTLRQLAVGNLGKCNIRLIIDSNPHLAGHTCRGIRIVPPTTLTNQDRERIWVSAFSPLTIRSIQHYAKETLGLVNEFIRLPS